MEKKKKIELIITAVLVIVLIFLVNNARRAMQKMRELREKTLYPTTVQQGETVLPITEVLPQESRVSLPTGQRAQYKILETQTKYLSLRRDPFTANMIARTEESLSSLELNGIVWDKKHPLALINNSIVEIGGSIGANTVVDIKKDRVILNDGTKTFTLKL